jgi:hypothetical protein
MKKQLSAFLFILFAATSFAQTSNNVDTVRFCFIKYKVPAGCTAESRSQVKCDNYSISWIDLTPEILKTMPDQVVNQMAGQFKKFKKEAITCYLLDNPVKGYKVSYKTDRGTTYQIVAAGVANEQPVLVQLVLDKEPKTDADIPEFPKQMIRLSK